MFHSTRSSVVVGDSRRAGRGIRRCRAGTRRGSCRRRRATPAAIAGAEAQLATPQLRRPVDDGAHRGEHAAVDDVDERSFFEHGALQVEVVGGVQDVAEHADQDHPEAEEGEQHRRREVEAGAVVGRAVCRPRAARATPRIGSALNSRNGTRSRTFSRGRRFSWLPAHGRFWMFCWVTPARAATPTRPRPANITPRSGVRRPNTIGTSSASMPIAGMANRNVTGWVKIQPAQVRCLRCRRSRCGRCGGRGRGRRACRRAPASRG
jgi:hypothetical protein